ncbi:hypothetical protein BDV40DRAFT_309140 [Aspergillus tamarii]|uniref:Aminoglycoside phosphotransferase domain-containing protein n=1 Tax=Aspergillus tamarii TaxID=41984 RepID=A0A5N6UE95_ASPTM|nr:hypothetical protein BDV40DRAFT_309140 [Aspergillus tamarii]
MSQSSNASSDRQDEMAIFQQILNYVDLAKIPPFALSIRQEVERQEGGTPTCTSCSVLPERFFGSNNILFPLEFNTGQKWLLTQKTVIPITTVFSFSASLDNDLECPYILMEYVDGKSTRHVWFNEELDAATLERHRTQVLQDLSKIMLQLNKSPFSKGSSPIFDDGNNPMGVGPLRVMDMPAMMEELRTNDVWDTVIQSEIEPNSDPKAWMLCMFERHEPPDDKFSQGAHRLLKQPFVLTHPDFNFQNILRYPGWLSRDWDPMKYGYGMEECFVQENSPEGLSCYRHIYREMVKAAIADPEVDADASAIAFSKKNLDRHLLVMESFSIVADQPINLPEIVQKPFTEVSKQEGFPQDLELWEVWFGLADGDLDDEHLESVRCGFEQLLQTPQ